MNDRNSKLTLMHTGKWFRIGEYECPTNKMSSNCIHLGKNTNNNSKRNIPNKQYTSNRNIGMTTDNPNNIDKIVKDNTGKPFLNRPIQERVYQVQGNKQEIWHEIKRIQRRHGYSPLQDEISNEVNYYMDQIMYDWENNNGAGGEDLNMVFTCAPCGSSKKGICMGFGTCMGCRTGIGGPEPWVNQNFNTDVGGANVDINVGADSSYGGNYSCSVNITW